MDAAQLDELEAICISALYSHNNSTNDTALEEINQSYAKIATPEIVLDLIKQFRTSCELSKLLTKAAVMTEGIARTRSYFNKEKYGSICTELNKLRGEICLPTKF